MASEVEATEPTPPSAESRPNPTLSMPVTAVVGIAARGVAEDVDVPLNGHSRKPKLCSEMDAELLLDDDVELKEVTFAFVRTSCTRSATISYLPFWPLPSGLFARTIVIVAWKSGVVGTMAPL